MLRGLLQIVVRAAVLSLSRQPANFVRTLLGTLEAAEKLQACLVSSPPPPYLDEWRDTRIVYFARASVVKH